MFCALLSSDVSIETDFIMLLLLLRLLYTWPTVELAFYAILARVGDCTLIGASGEYSDFQHIMEVMEDNQQYDVNMDDGFERSPSEIYNLLRTIMYNRRCAKCLCT